MTTQNFIINGNTATNNSNLTVGQDTQFITGKEPATSSRNPLPPLSPLPPKLEYHEFANLFSMFSDEDFNTLVEDIRQNGLEDKIVLLNGKVLDGRNRYEGLLVLGIDPKPYCTEYTGDDPLGFVLSKNLHRRHLDESQRAMIAHQLVTMRQGERTDLQPSESIPKVSQAEAAKRMGVSTRLVGQAKQVEASGCPELVEGVLNGSLPLGTAVKQLKAKSAPSNPSGHAKTSKREMAERKIKGKSSLLPTESTEASEQEFLDKVQSGEYNGKLFKKNVAKIRKALTAIDTLSEGLSSLFPETFELVRNQEEEGKLQEMLDLADECSTSLSAQVAIFRDLFAPKGNAPTPDNPNRQDVDTPILTARASDGRYDAQGKMGDDGKKFVVFAGSRISQTEANALPGVHKAKRSELQSTGAINDNYTFVQDCFFDTISAAACVVSGGSRSGNDVWKKNAV